MIHMLLSSAYIKLRTFLLLMLSTNQGGWGYTRSWERTQQGQLILTHQRDIPHHIVCSAIKAGGKRQGWKRGTRHDGICLPKKLQHTM